MKTIKFWYYFYWKNFETKIGLKITTFRSIFTFSKFANLEI